ncbi:MAG: OmpH family outer membrane protein [Paracoccaceae bacterium]
MRVFLRSLIVAGVLFGVPATFLAAPVWAQQASASLPFRTLDQDRLLRESRLGQQVLAAIEERARALDAENQQLVDQLAAEEMALTEARATLSPEEFRARADAFDTRVEEIRAEREQRIQELAAENDQMRQQFYDIATPVLQALLADQGIVAVLYPDVVIWGDLAALDITSTLIERLDQAAPASLPQQP